MSIEESYFHNRAICPCPACVRERERMAGTPDPEPEQKRLVVHRYEDAATCGPDNDEPPFAG
jgi:hypothetical protein